MPKKDTRTNLLGQRGARLRPPRRTIRREVNLNDLEWQQAKAFAGEHFNGYFSKMVRTALEHFMRYSKHKQSQQPKQKTPDTRTNQVPGETRKNGTDQHSIKPSSKTKQSTKNKDQS